MTSTLTEFQRAYIEAALWTCPELTYVDAAQRSAADFAPEALSAMCEDCDDFLSYLASVDRDALCDALGVDAEIPDDMLHDLSIDGGLAGSPPSALRAAVDADPERAGCDFWLTRNRHGAGFWDGDWDDNGEALADAARTFAARDLYIGDDGLVRVQ